MVIGQILGAEQTVAWLGSRREQVQTALQVTVRKLAMELAGYVKKDKLAGQALHVRSGRLRRSITFKVTSEGTVVSGLVGTNVVYARIHEFGGHTKPHIILPKNARALHFNGRYHPGSNFPERSFLRSALKDMTPEIRAELALSIRGALK